MDNDFFGLERGRFEISPDPQFLYPTRRHDEALANRCYAIRERKDFVALTGEVGLKIVGDGHGAAESKGEKSS